MEKKQELRKRLKPFLSKIDSEAIELVSTADCECSQCEGCSGAGSCDNCCDGATAECMWCSACNTTHPDGELCDYSTQSLRALLKDLYFVLATKEDMEIRKKRKLVK
tara:strand:- start:127 stop:447 length:321 start_codon:yes stop_codon:yes gene_type:complete